MTVIGLCITTSGAASVPSDSTVSRALPGGSVSAPDTDSGVSYSMPAALTTAPEKCLSSRRAVAYYRAHTHQRQTARGGTLSDRTPIVRGKSCRWARYAASVWVARAKAAAKALVAWQYEYDWRSWLPAVWKAIIQCETQSNFQHSNSSYEGAFGFALSSWDSFRRGGYPRRAYLATPRQQYNVALAIHARYGFSGWGCA